MRFSIRGSRWCSLCGLAAAGLILALAGCAGSETAEDQVTEAAASGEAAAEPDELGAIAAHQKLIQALEAGDAAALTALLDPSPELLIFHPFKQSRFGGVEEIDQGLSRMFEDVGSLSWTEMHQTIRIDGNIAWLTAQLIVRSAELPQPFLGRSTEIWVHGPEGWRLSHAHWSQDAKLAASLREEP